jgi:adenylate kinase family enzyme
VKRVTIIASASGSGKTTVGRRLAEQLEVPYHELDAIHHQAGWRELEADEFRRRVEPIVAADGWVIDGTYRGKLGDLTLARADTVVWLDLPIRIWLPRLVRRTHRRIRGHEQLWNDNRESLRTAYWGRESLVGYALGSHFRNRRELPGRLAPYRVVRLRTPSEVDRFVRDAAST